MSSVPETAEPGVVKRKKIVRKKLFGKGGAIKPGTPTVDAEPASDKTPEEEEDFFNLARSYDLEAEKKAKIKEEEERRLKEEKREVEVLDSNDEEEEDDSFLAPEPVKRSESVKQPEETSQAASSTRQDSVTTQGSGKNKEDLVELLSSDEEDNELEVDNDPIYRPSKRIRTPSRPQTYGTDEIEILDNRTVSTRAYSLPEDLAIQPRIIPEPEPQHQDPEMDPALLEKIRRRKAELAALVETRSFTIGVIIRPLIDEFDSAATTPPLVTTQESTTSMGDIRKQFLAKLWEHNPYVPQSTRDYYYENCVLVWNNTRVFDFATPLSLGVSQRSPSMLLNAMMVDAFERNMEHEFQLKLAAPEPVDYEALVRQQLGELTNTDADGAGATTGAGTEASADAEEEGSADGYFRVVMKGKDNQNVEVQVNAETQVRKMAEYYGKQRGLAADKIAAITLLFDDEELDMDSVVGDTELEEDFTIDVYIN